MKNDLFCVRMIRFKGIETFDDWRSTMILTPLSGKLEPAFEWSPIDGAPLSEKNMMMLFSSIFFSSNFCMTLPTSLSSIETTAKSIFKN